MQKIVVQIKIKFLSYYRNYSDNIYYKLFKKIFLHLSKQVDSSYSDFLIVMFVQYYLRKVHRL